MATAIRFQTLMVTIAHVSSTVSCSLKCLRTSSMEYAGSWKRFVAILIDSILLGIIGAILTALVDETASSTIATLLGWLYYAGMESSSRQATLGKSLMRIYVAGLDGQRISFLRATGRYFAKILSALILMIGFLMAAFTARKQALHDKIAGTLVLTR